jgi:hypothetical protein
LNPPNYFAPHSGAANRRKQTATKTRVGTEIATALGRSLDSLTFVPYLFVIRRLFLFGVGVAVFGLVASVV